MGIFALSECGNVRLLLKRRPPPLNARLLPRRPMAATIDATAGGANANSYMTLTEANTSMEAMISSTDAARDDGNG